MVDEHYDLVAIAGSAGGLRALTEIVNQLDDAFAAPILLALHRGDRPSDYLVTMLARSTSLAVREAQEGERPRPGTIYIAPGGRHLELDGAGRITVQRCGRVDFVCPSADLLFRSVAARYAERSLVVILTGKGGDGAHGARAVRKAGGFVLVQDPRDSECPGMPASAIETRKVDLILPLAHLGFALRSIVGMPCNRLSTSLPSPRPPAA